MIKSILICSELELQGHCVNANEEGSPKEVDGRSAISGQKIKYCLFESMNNFNMDDPDKQNTMFTNPDGGSEDINTDISADLRGYMFTDDNKFANKRSSPIYTSYAISKNKSSFFDDLFTRSCKGLDENHVSGYEITEHNKQHINDKQYSKSDIYTLNYSLNLRELSITKYYTYDKSKHINTVYIKHVEEKERKRRCELFIKSTSVIQGFANQARNAVDNTPNKIFICFEELHTFKKYFDLTEQEQKNYLQDLNNRNIKYFIGDNKTDKNVYSAYSEAIEYLKNNDIYDPSNNTILTQEEAKRKYIIYPTKIKTKNKNKIEVEEQN